MCSLWQALDLQPLQEIPVAVSFRDGQPADLSLVTNPLKILVSCSFP